MTPVPASPDPESGPLRGPRPVARRAPAVPAISVGRLEDVCPGSLLVAMPALTDPTFAGTVVYVLDHSDTGTLGVVLGRPSQVEIRDVLPGWCDLAVEPGVFHVGGPCETDTALCLATAPAAAADEDSPLRRVADDVHLVDLDVDPADLTEQLTGPARLRRLRGLVPRPAGRRARRGRLGLRARPAGRRPQPGVRARSCGARSWAGRPGGSPCSPPRRRIPPSTEGARNAPHLVGSTRERAVWGRGRPLPLSCGPVRRSPGLLRARARPRASGMIRHRPRSAPPRAGPAQRRPVVGQRHRHVDVAGRRPAA